MFWIRLALSVVLAVLFVPVVAFAGVSLLLGCLLLTSLVLMLSVVVFPLFVGQAQMRLVRVALLAAVVAVGIMSRKVVLREVQGSLNRMTARLEKRGERGLSATDKLALYGLSMSMGLVGKLVYPEAAREHLYLHQRGPRVRRWSSDFPMQAPEVREHLRRYAAKLAKSRPQRDRIALPEETFTFVYGKTSWPVALALNPLTVRGEAVRAGSDWEFRVAGVVPVSYPQHSKVSVPVPRVGKLIVEEGLFHSLQQAGMLHPYVAEYHWRVSAGQLLNQERE